jgi:hypothetical protein
LRIVGSLLTVLALGFGILNLVAVLAHGERRTETTFTASEVDAIELGTANGSVRVIGGDRDDVAVQVDVSDGLVATELDARVDDRRLVLDARCPWLGEWWCRADYTVHAPRSTAILVHGDDGAVRVTGIDAPVDVRASG